MDLQPARVETEEPALDYGVTGRRIAAAFIDILVLTALFVIIAAAMGDIGQAKVGERLEGSFFYWTSGQNVYYVMLPGGVFLLFLIVGFVYFVVFEALAGSTLGKMSLGISVVDAEDGSKCSWPASLIRNLVRIVDGLPIFYIVGLIAVAVNERKQRLGDLAAKTLVVRAR